MTEMPNPLVHGWRYGMHPRAVGMEVRAIGRIVIPLGEALRIELAADEPDASGTGNLQYYILTAAGPWALWLSCRRADVAAAEAVLAGLEYPVADASQASARSSSQASSGGGGAC